LITVAVDVETSDTIGVYLRLPKSRSSPRAMSRASANSSAAMRRIALATWTIHSSSCWTVS